MKRYDFDQGSGHGYSSIGASMDEASDGEYVKYEDVNNRVIACEEMLRSIRRQLNQWADESRSGGWSTHQVDPQRELAAKIQQFLGRR